MMLRVQHQQQAAQFLAYHGKRGGDWVNDFHYWAGSKDLRMPDYIAIKTMVLEMLASRGVVPAEMDGVA